MRPDDFPPEVWALTIKGQMERLNRNYGRVYCELIPKPYRRQFRWTIDWLGLFGLPVAAIFGAQIRAGRKFGWFA